MRKLIAIGILFLLLGSYIIYKANDVDFKDGDDRKTFIVKFSKWVWQLGGNAKRVTANVIAQDWLPDDTNSTTE